MVPGMTDNSVAVRRLSKRKRFLFAATALLISFAIVELISWLALQTLFENGSELIRLQRQSLAAGGTAKSSMNEVIHPYLGWVMNPDTCSPSTILGHQIPVNGFGFNDQELTVPKRDTDRIIVGVLGGSVAWQMTAYGESALRESLRAHSAWRDKDIQLVRLAMSGHKQPQQLMTLNFMLALGAEFDVIVNVDGYNETALPSCENDRSGVFAAYPRMWHARTLDIVDPRVYGKSLQLFQIRGARQNAAQWLQDSWVWSSPTMNVVWKLRDLSWEHQLLDLATELADRRRKFDRGFAAQGPTQVYTGDEAMFDHLRDLWKNCSLQIHHLCLANGTKYIHALQPNQYLPGSKPLSEFERIAVVDPSQEYGRAIAKAYPMLIDEGKRLRERGVDFHDLTMLFATTDETIYSDPYCHYNQQGNEMLARTVASKIVESFANGGQ